MFLVSAQHIAPEWTLTNEAFADVTLGEWASHRVNGDAVNGYYAIAPHFGCGHTKPTKEAAIRSLLLANGCHTVCIKG